MSPKAEEIGELTMEERPDEEEVRNGTSLRSEIYRYHDCIIAAHLLAEQGQVALGFACLVKGAAGLARRQPPEEGPYSALIRRRYRGAVARYTLRFGEKLLG